MAKARYVFTYVVDGSLEIYLESDPEDESDFSGYMMFWRTCKQLKDDYEALVNAMRDNTYAGLVGLTVPVKDGHGVGTVYDLFEGTEDSV